MTPAEYIQLKAFARIDGLFVAVLWVMSFACYIIGLSSSMWAMAAMLLAMSTPFFVANRLRLFRDGARDGIISLKRGWAFVVLVFFYGGLLFAIAQYAYFAFMDKGYLLNSLQQLMESPEASQMMAQQGMTDMVNEAMAQLQSMRPIDISLNMLTTNILLGFVLGLPIAAVMRRKLKIEK